MVVIRQFTTVLARFLISLVFLAGAANKILHWHETERSLMNTLCEWQANIGFSEGLQDCLATLVPWTPVLMIVATLFELVGGLSILLGIKEKLGATLLVLFIIPTTILIHQFWFVEGSAREVQITHFLKNMAILGGLLMILLQGTERAKISFPPKFG
ncbi:MAG TPA: DoxX family protein [Chlamydiales bacterium]|nr:DoxX family protein [Chlamydiales bacterium]